MVSGNRDNYDIVPGNQLNILLCQIESIDWPASVLLAGSLTGVAGSNGITVNASDVTIDLGGHTLLGVPGSLDGIAVARDSSSKPRTNVSVKNGTVRHWGDVGINADGADNGQYRELRLLSNGTRVSLWGFRCGSNNLVIGCCAMNNSGHGIVAAGTNCCIRDCAAQENSGVGISVDRGTIHNCTAYLNKADGIQADFYNTIQQCVSTQNGGDGIVVSLNCYVVSNNCSANDGAGIRSSVKGNGNRIESNHVSDNKVAGVVVEAPGNLIIRNSAANNGPGGAGVPEYDIVSGNTVGPVRGGELDNDSNPHANYNM